MNKTRLYRSKFYQQGNSVAYDDYYLIAQRNEDNKTDKNGRVCIFLSYTHFNYRFKIGSLRKFEPLC